MSKLQQSIQQLEPATRPRSVVIGRQITTYLLSAFIILVMVVWFGFLGWGAFAFLQWLFEWFKALSVQ